MPEESGQTSGSQEEVIESSNPIPVDQPQERASAWQEYQDQLDDIYARRDQVEQLRAKGVYNAEQTLYYYEFLDREQQHLHKRYRG